METTITQQDNATVLTLIGRLDTPSAQEVNKAITPLVEHPAGTLIIDCSQMSYISSSGLRIFLTLRKAAAAANGRVVVRGISPDIRNVFMMTGFLNLFEIEG